MSDIHKSLRLGDLLVEKGLLTHPQLRQAIEIQQALQSQRFGSKNINARTELGEILIELGFISRHQLQANLNWQRRLKATTAVMVFIAPLLTAACGGGAAGGSSANAGTGNSQVTSESLAAAAAPKPEPTTNSSSTAKVVSSASSLPKSVSSSSSKKSLSSSAVSSSSSSSAVDGSVQLYWSVPSQRENGDYLDITEIGGYELRYKMKGDSTFKSIVIKDGFTDAYYFDYLKGDYEFQIATFDKEGLYSGFVSVNPS